MCHFIDILQIDQFRSDDKLNNNKSSLEFMSQIKKTAVFQLKTDFYTMQCVELC